MAEHLHLIPVARRLVGAVAGGLLFADLRPPPRVGARPAAGRPARRPA